MINDKIINIAIDAEQQQKVRQNSASSLPLNPTAQGWSAQKIREKLYRAICSDVPSLDLDDNLLDIIVNKLLSVQEVFTALQSGEFVVKKAELFDDGENGQSIKLTFQTLENRMDTAESDIDKIEDGTTIVKKAEQDGSGRVIENTYASQVGVIYTPQTGNIKVRIANPKQDIRIGGASDEISSSSFTLPKASIDYAGLMSKEDKAYVDGLPSALALKENKGAKNQNNGYAGLNSDGKIPTSLLPDSIVGQLVYKGVFNPNNGYPSSPEKGWYYISTNNGTISGVEYHIGDWAVYNGSSWDKVDNTDAVASVNEKIGNVVLDGTDLQVGNGDATTIEQRFVNIDDELDNRYTKEEVDLLTADGGGDENLDTLIEDIQDGTMIVKKAEQDQLGNVINTTYETKTAANLVRGRVTLLENANMVKSVSYEQLTHKITFTFYDNTTQLLDLPLESTIVGASYDNATKDITFTLQNNSTLIVPLDDLVSGLAAATHTHTKSEITDFPTSMPPTAHNHDSDYYKKGETYSKEEVDDLVANGGGGGGGDIAGLIEDLQDGTIVVDSALNDNEGNPIVHTYAASMSTSYNDTDNEILIELQNKDGNPLDNETIILPLATTLKDGLLSKEDKVKINNIATDISSMGTTKQSSSEKNKNNGYAGLDSNAKILSSLLPDSILGQLEYKGTFNPISGYPVSPEKGWFYIANANALISGADYKVGDWAVYNGLSWDKVDNTDAVVSVNNKLGTVTLYGSEIQVSNVDTNTIEQKIGYIYDELSYRYTKAETYSKGETYSKEEVDDLVAGGGGSSDKVSKVTTAGLAAYTKNGATQSTMNIDNTAPTASTLVQRDTSGRIKASAGVANNDVVNVQQLNNALGDIESALDAIMGV